MKHYSWLIFFLLASNVCAQGIGVSPTKLEVKLLRGQEARTSFIVFNPSDESIEFSIYNKELPIWFEFIPTHGTIDAKANKEIDVLIKPDDLVSNGEYNSLIYVGLDGKSYRQGLSLDIGTAIKTKIIITGKQIINLIVKDITIKDVEQDSFVIFEFDVLNNGNVKVKPNAEITIKRNGFIIDKFERGLDEVIPGESKRLIAEWNTTNKDVGDYIALVELRINDRVIKQASLDFKVLPYGELGIDGELKELVVVKDISTEDIVKIKGIFVNKGNTNVKARLNGELYYNNKFIDIFESEEFLVMSGEEKELIAYINSLQQGNYKIKASVFYNGKQTSVKELFFSIKENKSPNQHIFGTVIMFSIVISGYFSYEVFRKIKS